MLSAVAGYKLDETEVTQLLDSLDLAHTGQVAKSQLAASQIDWREVSCGWCLAGPGLPWKCLKPACSVAVAALPLELIQARAQVQLLWALFWVQIWPWLTCMWHSHGIAIVVHCCLLQRPLPG